MNYSVQLAIDFQNEFLVARIGQEYLASVPDLICLVESDGGRPLQTEEVRYGLRLSVLGLPAPSALRTEAALRVVGPRAFGYDLNYEPIGAYVAPLPVGALITPEPPEKRARC